MRDEKTFVETAELCLRTIEDNVNFALSLMRASKFNRNDETEHHREVVLARMREVRAFAMNWARARRLTPIRLSRFPPRPLTRSMALRASILRAALQCSQSSGLTGLWLTFPGNELANAGIALHNWAVDRAAQGIETAQPPRREAGLARKGESPVVAISDDAPKTSSTHGENHG